MSAYKFYTAIVIEPLPEKRLQLRQVAAAAPCFNKVEPIPSFESALAHLADHQCDVVFIGDLPLADASKFIEKGKATEQGRLSAYIFLRPQQGQSEASVAVDVISGADSILYAPYSVDNVVSTTKIADSIKEADAQARKKAAMSMLLGTVMTEVDQIGDLSSRPELGEKPQFGKIKQLGEQLKLATKSAAVDYFGTLSKAFVEAKPPVDKRNRQNYGGVSARVQRLIDKKAKKPEE